ncbi:MAG: hypothetical protein IPK60_09920 [Sandaracinaceae bacterium]|nr:hypothetical protein [Sandaracinaceae bacterium]
MNATFTMPGSDAISLVRFSAQFNAPSLSDAVTVAVNALRDSKLEISAWCSPAAMKYKRLGAYEMPTGQTGRKGNADTAVLKLSDGSLVSVFHPWKQSHWNVDTDLVVDSVQGAAETIANASRLARRMLAEPTTTTANISLIAADAWGPAVPLVGPRMLALTCTEHEVRDGYEDPAAFWDSGWTGIEPFGARSFLTRALECSNMVECMRATLPQQLALARNAKPGLSKYGSPALTAATQEVYFAGEPALNTVGYLDAEEAVELACALKPPLHVQAWEVTNIEAALRAKTLPDGRHVRAVHVVFLYESMAHAEKRPLLDVGAKVFYYDSEGALRAY